MFTKKVVSEKPEQQPTIHSKRSLSKWIALGLGTFVGISHIGLLGYVVNTGKLQYPVINFPRGDYSSYEVEATRDGYRIKYKANDPAILNSERQLKLDQKKGGLFGGGVSKADLEKLIAAAAQTAPAQTIRIEQAPIQIATAPKKDGEPPVMPTI